MSPASDRESAATATPSVQSNAGAVQLVGFCLGTEEFGLEILKVQEIIRKPELTRMPNSPDFVEGVINLRGKIIPVIALRRRFGLPPRQHDRSTRIVVAEVAGAVIGFEVDSVSEVLRLQRDALEPPPRLTKVEREFISGVGKLEDRLLLLLDADRLLDASETAAVTGSAVRSPEASELAPSGVLA